MTDLHIINGATVTIAAISKKGQSFFAKKFGYGATSIALPQSWLPRFTNDAVEKGIKWQTFTPSAYATLYPKSALVSAANTNQSRAAN